jgi:pimeloyl-ACP methyl ester carboxylesterase
VQQSSDPVILVPGFMAGDATLLLLSRHLRRIGYRTYRSRIRANVGCTAKAAAALEQRIERLVEQHGGKATLVGHSLGGLMARAVAAQRPDLVDGIITLGSPLLAPGAVHRLLALDLALLVSLQRVGVAALMGLDCTAGDCARLSWERARAVLDPGVAFTSVFSRRDGIVDWRSCLDPGAHAVEVMASHLGMAVDPEVFDLVAGVIGEQRGRGEARIAS